MISDAVAPLQTAIDNLGQRLTLVETAVTGQTSNIQSLNSRISNLESSQVTPSFNILPYVVASKNIQANGYFDKIVTDVKATGTGIDGYLPNATFWGYAKTPDGTVISSSYTLSQWHEFQIIFQMPNYYTAETPIEVEIYTEYGGKVGKTIVNL